MRNEGPPAFPSGPGDPLAGRRVLVLISGSIAAVKLPLLVSALVQRGALVRCVLSPSAEGLVSAVALASLSRAPCHLEADQWSHQAPRPLHIELAEWAEVVLLAPLSATSLARWVHGLADTLLASTLLACEAPVLAAPAMNSAMWAAPAVRRNWRELQSWERVLPLEPGSGLLACDRVGDGRMADPAVLLLALESLLLVGCRRDWRGRRLLVSAGPTREPLDPARCLTNPSTGRMGVLLAQAARFRGATVDLVHGPLAVDPAWLEGLQVHPVDTAAAMQAALEGLQAGADAIAMAAAVADHRRSAPETAKLAKQDLEACLATGWEPVPDLLAALVRRRPPAQAILGFAAQSGEVLQEARAKFARKGCDLLFANPIDRPGAGFASATNDGWLLGPGSRERRFEAGGKLALAHRLLSALAEVLTLRIPDRVPAGR
ncbi:bifunctional phosphopantothenoylcysteine decarboxylase/phosphopantothenate--cysteine ligase CoaBC [Synechococcus sp. CCY 9618]|uniref:bifunctional phosphopantothenoylcysteine decarboxylase/phosphopantothenate--cysteine ligase CoaBC n=1 Tax=Synechococcus sp. CCY 9618 TaxID=2815602 RepID=UPI001C2188E5|nr:bifunctional phosphopantothenoylcysteine decarboxylase/phosphopantothenate--cysteine ligase CoaBC [Synechococcus sp. CCY 9618]